MGIKNYYWNIWKTGRENTKKYYHQDRRAWTYNIASSILIAIISPIVYNGVGLIMDNQFLLSVLAGLLSGGIFFVIWRTVVFIYHLVEAPILTHQEKETQIEKIKRDMEIELEKYNWNNVEYSVTPFYMIGKSGWALEIENNKNYDLSQVVVEITKIRKDEKNIPLSGLFLLGYIDRQRGSLGDKIVNSSKRSGIKQGEKREYVITSEIVKTKSSKTHQFETYPDKLLWDFPLETNGGVLGNLNRSMIAMAAFYAADQSPPDPVTVVEICLKATLDINDEVIILPYKKLRIQVGMSGALSWYEDDDDGN